MTLTQMFGHTNGRRTCNLSSLLFTTSSTAWVRATWLTIAPAVGLGSKRFWDDSTSTGWRLRDVMYEVPQPDKVPEPMNTGTNGYSIDPAYLMSRHLQQWRIV